MPPPIAVVGFLPDAGHVRPLLRLAAAFSRRGYPVVCYLPQECASYLDGYDFRFVSLGRSRTKAMEDAYQRTLFKLSRRSIFYNGFSRYVDLRWRILEPLQRRASAHVEVVRSSLRRERPLFLLCDDHVFSGRYAELARAVEVPLVLHTFEGHRHRQRPYVQLYGLSETPGAFQTVVEGLGYLSRRVFEVRRRLGALSTRLGGLEPAPANSDDGGGTEQAIAISTGCGYLEERYLASALRLFPTPRMFKPLAPNVRLRLSAPLRGWLAQSEKPVVYVSFGSMIDLPSSLVRSILAGLAQVDVRVLWSMPQAQQDRVLTGPSIPASVRFETFVSPLDVLAMPTVRGGINHAGAGSVQDCLLTGTPMLCIPFMWDQPFNASVIARLGIGLRLWKRRASAGAIARAVRALLDDDRFHRRAQEIARELRDGEAAVVDYVLDHPRIALAQRRSASLGRPDGR